MNVDPLLAQPSRRSGAPRAATPPAPHRHRRAAVALGICGIAALVGVGVALASGESSRDATATSSAAVTTGAASATATPTTTTPSIDAPGSLWWIVNPSRPLAADYVPPDLVTPNVPLKPDTGASQLGATTALGFEALVADAANVGHQLQLNSGYRSYEQQQMLYDRFVEDFGLEVAAERVALPGTSEHQTALAADVGLVGLPDDQVFGDTAASVWVTDNAYRFGFILRYPPDKAHITGYANEPWHLRYVGVELAAELHTSGLTMEEHFGLGPPPTTS